MDAVREGGRFWKLFNFLLLQAAWFGCVLSAAAGATWAAWLSAAAALALHFALLRERRPDVTMIAAALVVGLLTDTVLRAAGVFDVPGDPMPAPLPATWFLGLWAVFGTAIRHSMGWLSGRYLAAAMLGAVGGPMSLTGGARLGAVTLHADARLAWGAVAAQWVVALPLLLLAASRAASRSG